MSFLRLLGYIIIVLVFNLVGLLLVCFLESRRVKSEGGSSFLASLWDIFVGLIKFIIAIIIIGLAIYSFTHLSWWDSSDNAKSSVTSKEQKQVKSKKHPKPSVESTKDSTPKETDPLEKLSSSELRAMWEVSAHDLELRKRIDNILIKRTRNKSQP